MTEIILCDDNSMILNVYEQRLLSIAKEACLMIHIQKYKSGEQLLFALEDNPQYADIIFMDILMGELNGIQTAKKLRQAGCMAQLIFLTSCEEYVYDSFEVDAVHYLLKNEITDDKFKTAFLKAVTLSKKQHSNFLLCESNSITKKIPMDQISFLEVKNRIVTVHFNDTTFDFYSTMERLESTLTSNNFMRVHRSYMINFRYVDQVSKNSILLLTGDSIPMGSTYIKDMKQTFTAYLKNAL